MAAGVIIAAAAGLGAIVGAGSAHGRADPTPTTRAFASGLPSTTASAPIVTTTTVTTATVQSEQSTIATVAVEATIPIEDTTSTTAPIEATGGTVDALELLATIPVQLEHPTGYSRDLFAIWSDLNGDGCDTRAEVLMAESLTPAQVDSSGCTVVAGDWLSSYDGLTFTSPADLDIDHVVALKEAWDSGAWQWTAEQRIAYGNDTTDSRTLAAVSATSNRSKGDKDPSNWLPPDTKAICQYLSDWVSIKARWGLSMDQSEWGRIKNQLTAGCPGLRIPRRTG